MNHIGQNMLTKPWVIAIIAVFCCALWGSATPLIKTGYRLALPVENVPSIIVFAGVRFFLAGVLTVLVYSLIRRKFLWPSKSSWIPIFKIGSFQTVIQYSLFYIGLSNTTGVKGTMGSATNTFFSILIACLIVKQEKLTFKKILACLIGFLGITLVNLNGLELTFKPTGDGLVLLSAVAYGVSSVLMKRYSTQEDPVVLSGYQFVWSGLAMSMIGFLFGGRISISGLTGTSVLLFLSFISAAAYSLWGVLLKYNPVSKVTVYCFTIPICGVLLSMVMLPEQSNVSPLNLLAALVLICTGIFIVNYSKKPN